METTKTRECWQWFRTVSACDCVSVADSSEDVEDDEQMRMKWKRGWKIAMNRTVQQIIIDVRDMSALLERIWNKRVSVAFEYIPFNIIVVVAMDDVDACQYGCNHSGKCMTVLLCVCVCRCGSILLFAAILPLFCGKEQNRKTSTRRHQNRWTNTNALQHRKACNINTNFCLSIISFFSSGSFILRFAFVTTFFAYRMRFFSSFFLVLTFHTFILNMVNDSRDFDLSS